MRKGALNSWYGQVKQLQRAIMPLMNIWACGYCCKMTSLCHYNHNIKQKKVELKLLRYLHVKFEYFPSPFFPLLPLSLEVPR